MIIVKLIEHDMYVTIAPDVAQQHHLAWLLGFVCGVRPGTIGFARNRKDQFLQWKDITITRSGNPSAMNFQVKVRFRWLKGYREEQRKSLLFTVAGPRTPEDVMYSIPHRLLAILLRRDLLQDYSDLTQLLGDNKRLIKIKDSALDLPVVCAVEPKGVSIISGRPSSSDKISAYIQRRALDYGLPPGITHYAWRRSAGESSPISIKSFELVTLISTTTASTA